MANMQITEGILEESPSMKTFWSLSTFQFYFFQ